jgi:uncharacterized protein YfaA (DUF2138 family)
LKQRIKWALGALGIAGAAAVALHGGLGWARYTGTINAANIDLAQPDGYIVTPALSRLPRDLVKSPLAKELLTEDFAFYYEEHPDRLGLVGTLKRIAYEHDTTFGDELVAAALDEPAEVALWADSKGAPRWWMVSMNRGVLARALQQAAPWAAKDTQVSVLGTLPGTGNDTVYALSLSPHRTLALVARGTRVVVLSDPGLLFTATHEVDRKSAERVTAMLSGDKAEQGVYRRALGLGEPGADHVIVADSSLLSFGWRHFFPGLRALRVDVSPRGETLRTQVRVADAKTLPGPEAAAALWEGVPAGPAACSWLPADWSRARAVLARAPAPDPVAIASAASATASPQALPESKDPMEAKGAAADAATGAAWDRFTATLDGPAAVCWYARSQFHTPLVVARVKEPGPATDAALARLAGWLMPGKAPVRTAGAGVAGGAHRWQREVAAPYGPDGAGETSLYHPTLARQGAWISFSPDDVLVDLALATEQRRYPSLASVMPAGTPTLAVFAPAQIADMTQREAFAVLPASQELFRQAAQAHLVPRLDTMRQWPAVRVVPQGAVGANGWVALSWLPLNAPKP